MSQRFILLLWALPLVIILAGCTRVAPADGMQPPKPTIDQAKLANPAAGYCQDQGFRYESRKDEQGNEYGVCIFDDGSECDAWAYFRGECGQDQAKNLVLNVVEAAGLTETKRIEIIAVGGETPQSLAVVTDPAIIQALVAPLNANLPLRPPKRCPASYELKFTLKDDQTRVFRLGLCGLYGDQAYWQGMTIAPPAAFTKTFNKLVTSTP